MLPISAQNPYAAANDTFSRGPARFTHSQMPPKAAHAPPAQDTYTSASPKPASQPSAQPDEPQGAVDPSQVMAEAIKQVCDSAQQTMHETITSVGHLIAMFQGLRAAWDAFSVGIKAVKMSTHHAGASIVSYLSGLAGRV
jgi:hypothetical protein